MTRAVIYARVSTTREEQATSIESQLASGRLRCEREGWQIAAEEQDKLTAFKRGSMARREGWQRVVALIRARAVDVLVIWHRDRISRNVREFADFREEVLDRYDVRIVPLMGIEVDPAILQTRWMEEDEVTQAQRFSELVSWKTREGRRRRLEAGYWCTRSPFGCRPGEERGVPVLDPAQWPVLAEMFQRAADGASWGELRRWLTAEGHPANGGGGWSLSSIGRILGNPFYLGEYWRDGEVLTLRHQCRIERGLWEAAQGEAQPRRRGGRPRGNGQYVYLLPRVVCSSYTLTSPARRAGEPLPLYCRQCVGRGGVRYPYYYRADRIRGSGGLVATESGAPLRGDGSLRAAVSAPALDHAVLTELASLGDRSGLLLCRLRDAGEARLEEARAEAASLGRSLARRRGELRRIEDGLLRAASHGSLPVTIDVLERRAGELRQLVAGAEQRRERLTFELDAAAQREPDLVRATQRINSIRELWQRGAWPELAELLSLVVDCVDLNLDQPVLRLRPVMNTVQLAAPTGGYSYPLRGLTQLIAA